MQHEALQPGEPSGVCNWWRVELLLVLELTDEIVTIRHHWLEDLPAHLQPLRAWNRTSWHCEPGASPFAINFRLPDDAQQDVVWHLQRCWSHVDPVVKTERGVDQNKDPPDHHRSRLLVLEDHAGQEDLKRHDQLWRKWHCLLELLPSICMDFVDERLETSVSHFRARHSQPLADPAYGIFERGQHCRTTPLIWEVDGVSHHRHYSGRIHPAWGCERPPTLQTSPNFWHSVW